MHDNDENPTAVAAEKLNIIKTYGSAARWCDLFQRLQSLDIPPSINLYAWDEDRLRERYKDPENVPARVRVRLYFVKCICIYGKGSGFANPYLEFTLGKSLFVTTRNVHAVNTNTPALYRMEERDVKMPEESRLAIGGSVLLRRNYSRRKDDNKGA